MRPRSRLLGKLLDRETHQLDRDQNVATGPYQGIQPRQGGKPRPGDVVDHHAVMALTGAGSAPEAHRVTGNVLNACEKTGA